jgi:transcriptional regulator with GAF, ATPase, and Fis domain
MPLIFQGHTVIFNGNQDDAETGLGRGDDSVERQAEFELEIWREVGRHLELEASVDRILPVLARRLPFEWVFIRQIDAERRRIETLVRAPSGKVPDDSSGVADLDDNTLRKLLDWWQRGTPLRLGSKAAGQRLPGLLPRHVQSEVLCGPLRGDAPTHCALLISARGQGFQRENESVFAAILDPFSVAVESDRRLRELKALREAAEADKQSLLARLGRLDIADSIVGADTGLSEVMGHVRLVARSDTPVLILGETGSGKEVVARSIHLQSSRAAGPFLRVNCGAIPPDLIDSELFGHERGSFTGAVAERKVWFERADGGTLFLDECGELPLPAQVRLLRVLQDGTLQRIGGERLLHVDVRVVAATHRDLPAMVGRGLFREDRWYRLAVFPIRLPPLRERLDDIAALATHFAQRAAKRLGLAPTLPAPEDIDVLKSYTWPGNVRELSAVIERAAILGGGTRLDVPRALGAGLGGATPASAGLGAAGPDLSPPAAAAPQRPLASLDAAMATHIQTALARTGGRIEGPEGAAVLLAINPHTLRSRMRKLGIDRRRFARLAR